MKLNCGNRNPFCEMKVTSFSVVLEVCTPAHEQYRSKLDCSLPEFDNGLIWKLFSRLNFELKVINSITKDTLQQITVLVKLLLSIRSSVVLCACSGQTGRSFPLVLQRQSVEAWEDVRGVVRVVSFAEWFVAVIF